MNSFDVRLSNTWDYEIARQKEEDEKMKDVLSSKYDLKKEEIKFDEVDSGLAPLHLKPKTLHESCGMKKIHMDKEDLFKFEERKEKQQQVIFKEMKNHMEKDPDQGVRWMTWSLGLSKDEKLGIGEDYTPKTECWGKVEGEKKIIAHYDYDISRLIKSASYEYHFLVSKIYKLDKIVTHFEYIYYNVLALMNALAHQTVVSNLNLNSQLVKMFKMYGMNFPVSDLIKEVINEYMVRFDKEKSEVHVFLPFSYLCDTKEEYLIFNEKKERIDATYEVSRSLCSVRRFFHALHTYSDDHTLLDNLFADLQIHKKTIPDLQVYYKYRTQQQDNSFYLYFKEIFSVGAIFKLVSVDHVYMQCYKTAKLLRVGPQNGYFIDQVPFTCRKCIYVDPVSHTPLMYTKEKTNYNLRGLKKVSPAMYASDKRVIPKQDRCKLYTISTFYKFHLKERFILEKSNWVPVGAVRSVKIRQLERMIREKEEIDDEDVQNEVMMLKSRLNTLVAERFKYKEERARIVQDIRASTVRWTSSSSSTDEKRKKKKHWDEWKKEYLSDLDESDWIDSG